MAKTLKYLVKDSDVHGKGVFAAKDIKKGKKIIEYTGNVITWEEANRRFVDRDGHSFTMFFGIDDQMVIDGADGGNEARFINHSCKPNCEAKNKNGRIFIYAKKNIKEGKELFYDYLLEIEGKITKKLLKKYACFCGNTKCRGTQLDLKK
ncbi:MAG: SET domain-containing protein-lysine N-methyltransferase [Saprospiraceae bacterium]|nr:SET domain-containing protein-lysine N-methyltransferase [Saprospiraceae bacterium]